MKTLFKMKNRVDACCLWYCFDEWQQERMRAEFYPEFTLTQLENDSCKLIELFKTSY